MLTTLALSNLGRTAGREGRLDDARTMLEDALETFDEIDAAGYALEARVRLAERAVLAQDATDALAQADAALTAIAEAAGGSLHHAFVHRVRGFALAQRGDFGGASEAFAHSLDLAREAEETYELALALEAIGRLKELRGQDGSAESNEARGLLARLGVISTPDLQLH
jgi:uncharacterized protein HemY